MERGGREPGSRFAADWRPVAAHRQPRVRQNTCSEQNSRGAGTQVSGVRRE